MATEISPEQLAQGFFELVESDQIRVKDDKQLAVRVSDFQLHSDAGVDLGINFQTGAGQLRNTLTGASVLTLTAAQSGSLIECGAAEDFVLPTITAANIGMWFEFVVTVTATTLTVTAATAQLLHGGVMTMSTGAGIESDAFSADGTDDLVMTLNGTTQGGIIGSTFKFTARTTTKWLVTGQLIGSGSLATNFS